MKWMKTRSNIKYALLIILSVLAAPSFAQVDKTQSLLWKISGNGLIQDSYLYGTIHIICKEDFRLSETIKQKFSASKAIYLEIDMDDPKFSSEMMQQMTLPKGQNLKGIFGESNFALVDSFMKAETKTSLAAFNSFKPMMVMSLLFQRMLPCKEIESYEMAFIKMAKEQKKELSGLELVADQIAVFDAIPDSLEVKSLVDMVKDFKRYQKDFSSMIDIYKSQNTEALYNLMVNSPDMMGSKELLLDQRNRNWIPLMETSMRKQSSFFAVGAGHLSGEVGVIELLRKKGYQVTAVAN